MRSDPPTVYSRYWSSSRGATRSNRFAVAEHAVWIRHTCRGKCTVATVPVVSMNRRWACLLRDFSTDLVMNRTIIHMVVVRFWQLHGFVYHPPSIHVQYDNGPQLSFDPSSQILRSMCCSYLLTFYTVKYLLCCLRALVFSWKLCLFVL